MRPINTCVITFVVWWVALTLSILASFTIWSFSTSIFLLSDFSWKRDSWALINSTGNRGQWEHWAGKVYSHRPILLLLLFSSQILISSPGNKKHHQFGLPNFVLANSVGFTSNGVVYCIYCIIGTFQLGYCQNLLYFWMTWQNLYGTSYWVSKRFWLLVHFLGLFFGNRYVSLLFYLLTFFFFLDPQIFHWDMYKEIFFRILK